MAHVRRAVQARGLVSSTNPVNIGGNMQSADTVLTVLIKVQSGTTRAGGAPYLRRNTSDAIPTEPSMIFAQANTAQKAATSPEASAEIWFLVNPPTNGTYFVSIPNTGTLPIFVTLEAGQAQAGMTSALDVANGANNTAVNPSPGSITTTKPGDIIWAITAGGWTTWAPTAQAGTVIANTDDGADGGGEQYTIQAAAGAIDMNWTFATSDDWGAVVAAFKEVPKNSFTNNYQSIKASSGNTGILSVGDRIR